MATVERLDFDVPATMISPALVSTCLTGDNTIDEAAVDEKSLSDNNPPFSLQTQTNDQTDDWFSDVIAMLQTIISLMNKIADNAAARSQLEAQMSTALQKQQAEVAQAAEAKRAEQEAEAARQKTISIILKVFGAIIEGIVCLSMAASGNIVGAIMSVALYAACVSGVVDQIVEPIVNAIAGPNASPIVKLIVKIAVILVLAVACGAVAGAAEGGLAAIGKDAASEAGEDFASVAFKTGKSYASTFGTQMMTSSNLAGDMAAAIVQFLPLSEEDKKKAQFWITIILNVLFACITLKVSSSGASNVSDTGAKIMDRIAEKAEQSPMWANIEKILTIASDGRLINSALIALQMVTLGAGILLGYTLLQRSYLTKEQGPLEAAQQMIFQLLDILNQRIKQSNEDLKTTQQIFREGIDQMSEITQATAYAASTLV